MATASLLNYNSISQAFGKRFINVFLLSFFSCAALSVSLFLSLWNKWNQIITAKMISAIYLFLQMRHVFVSNHNYFTFFFRCFLQPFLLSSPHLKLNRKLNEKRTRLWSSYNCNNDLNMLRRASSYFYRFKWISNRYVFNCRPFCCS